MSDWEFLHDMLNDGYSPEQIADAASCGYNPWEWQPICEKELPAIHSQPDPELVMIFESLVENAMSYHALTGRYLQIWGELGELYAEIKYGIKRHKPHTRGSDGKLGNNFIEIKTISPEKNGEQVQVKRAGNFSKEPRRKRRGFKDPSKTNSTAKADLGSGHRTRYPDGSFLPAASSGVS